MVRLILTLTFLLSLFVNSYCYTVPPVNITAYYDDFYFIYMADDDFSEFSIYVNLNEPLESIDQAVYRDTQYVPSAEEGWVIAIKWVAKVIDDGDVLNYIVTVKKNGELYTSEPRKFVVKEIFMTDSRPIAKMILQW